MTIKTEWQVSQLIKAGVYSNTDAVLNSALTALFVLHPDQKLRMLIAAYSSGEISLGKAAEWMGISTEEMRDLMRQAGIKIHLGPETADELKKEITALESS